MLDLVLPPSSTSTVVSPGRTNMVLEQTPVGRWPKDPLLKEIREMAQLTMETDLEG